MLPRLGDKFSKVLPKSRRKDWLGWWCKWKNVYLFKLYFSSRYSLTIFFKLLTIPFYFYISKVHYLVLDADVQHIGASSFGYTRLIGSVEPILFFLQGGELGLQS